MKRAFRVEIGKPNSDFPGLTADVLLGRIVGVLPNAFTIDVQEIHPDKRRSDQEIEDRINLLKAQMQSRRDLTPGRRRTLDDLEDVVELFVLEWVMGRVDL